MNKNNTKFPLLGLCPIGKFVFSHEDAVRQKRALQNKLRSWKVPFVDLDGVLPDGMVRDQSHVEPVVRHFQAKGVDAVFMPHCNFGTEGAVGMIGRKLGLPVLLWGPRDEAPRPDGTRLRDSLCGLFASSKVLHTLGVPFTYIENCRVNDRALKAGLDTFLRAAHAASALRRGLRIGLIGQRIDFFWCTIINESELLERFRVEVRPIDMVSFIEGTRKRLADNRTLYAREAKTLRAKIKIVGFSDNEPLMRILAVRDQMLALVEEHNLDGLAVQDFNSLVDAMGTYCLFASSMVADIVPVVMESDIHGAISAILLRRAALGAEAVFLTEFTVRHPKDDNGVLLWHAGAPVSMCRPGVKMELGHHWILPSPLAGMTHFTLKQGPITVARFECDHGAYKLAIGEGHSMPGPYTRNNYVWMKVDDWLHWERLLIEGGVIHHTAMAYGHYADVLAEATRYIPGLKPVMLKKGSKL